MRFRLASRSMTLDDLELENNVISGFRRQYLANSTHRSRAITCALARLSCLGGTKPNWGGLSPRLPMRLRGCGAQAICSYVFWPLSFLSGVNIRDCHKVAELLGAKTFLTPFIAYQQLSVLINNRRDLLNHVAQNGTWYWRGDDVILRTTGPEDTVLTNGIITVLNSAYCEL